MLKTNCGLTAQLKKYKTIKLWFEAQKRVRRPIEQEEGNKTLVQKTVGKHTLTNKTTNKREGTNTREQPNKKMTPW